MTSPEATAAKPLTSPRTRVMAVAALLIAGLAALIVGRMSARPSIPEPSAFAQEVDLSPLASSAIHARGRLKSFHSFADMMVRAISGPHDIFGQSPDFTYFDLLLRPERYADAEIVYIKNKGVRAQLAQALRQRADYPPERIERFMRVGLISPAVVTTDPQVRSVLSRMGRDAMRTAKFVDQLNNALAARMPTVLSDNLRLIPPPGITDPDAPTQWLPMNAVEGDSLARAPRDDAHAGLGVVPGMDPNLSADLSAAWSRFRLAWLSEDAQGVNESAATLASLLPAVNPEVYPAARRLSLESAYLDLNNFTWVWIVYLFSVVFLVMAVAYRWTPARGIGIGFFTLAFALHTVAVLLRWYVAGRWPNSNMFEAVTTAAWFGGAGAILLEVVARRAPMRNLFFLGSAVASMTALMAADFMPLSLTPTIGNMMPILHDVWLYIHTNVIIFSYVLIAMAAVTAILYLLYRLGGGTPDFARAGGAGALLSMNDAAASTARTPGVGAGPEAGPGGGSLKTTAGEVFDGATMVLLEMAFILLWAGTIMGAIWADHSWGRPWGWDPKEVFALNTFIIFVVLVHVRLKVKDKGLWTAWLALLGCAVMIFNWTVINFVISGLHSYA